MAPKRFILRGCGRREGWEWIGQLEKDVIMGYHAILDALHAVRVNRFPRWLADALDAPIDVDDDCGGGWHRRIVEALEARDPRERARRERARRETLREEARGMLNSMLDELQEEAELRKAAEVAAAAELDEEGTMGVLGPPSPPSASPPPAPAPPSHEA
eukprot:CAMPEP_0182865176 /NCGR_PEP_ID=MMETSP0034_2-20130328/7553_1 /TAXON_ID=156128 /ORGANISM="Nephroselmis pyriformis, Strain CCMP717" /LENGTH=158 /DNA_ID=CAMNT_0024997463 /DNA_START=526 /DNA_END=999 /DNA_ORIENTATION=+